MKRLLQSLTLNKALGLILGLLGTIALAAGDPYQGSTVTIDTRELARIVHGELDHVTPVELATWIIEGRRNYRLLDLRNDTDYVAYHIPGAEHVPLTGLQDHGLQRNETIVLYSEGGIHSAQGWFLLKAQGYHATYILQGGLDEWKETVLYPRPPASPAGEKSGDFDRQKFISAYFGGTPRSEAADQHPTVSAPLPRPAAPAAPAPHDASPRKKKKEGC